MITANKSAPEQVEQEQPVPETVAAPPAELIDSEFIQLSQSVKVTRKCANLFGAIAAAQGEFGKVLKDVTAKIQTKTGGQYQYSYADLASVLEAIREPLSKHGLAVLQPPSYASQGGSRVNVLSILAHSSGECMICSLVLPVEFSDKNPPAQCIGSALTYGRRYGLSGLLSIASEADDDGAGAGAGKRPDNGRNNQQPQLTQQGEQNGNGNRRTGSQGQKKETPPPAPAADHKPQTSAATPKAAIEAPAASQTQDSAATSTPAAPETKPAPVQGDPVGNLKTTLFRFYACTKKEDCDLLLTQVCSSEEKNLDYFVEHPEECAGALECLEFAVTHHKCEKRHLLGEIRGMTAAI